MMSCTNNTAGLTDDIPENQEALTLEELQASLPLPKVEQFNPIHLDEALDIEHFRVEKSQKNISMAKKSSTGYEIMELPGFVQGNPAGWAFGVNAGGQVVGESFSHQGNRAFLWDAATGLQNLGGSTSRGSQARKVNDLGLAAGSNYDVNEVGIPATIATVWDPVQGMKMIGVLEPAFYGANSEAFSVNNKGQVVGNSRTAYGWQAFIWDEDNGMREIDLGLAGYSRTYAVDINNEGVVVGYYLDSRGSYSSFTWDESNGVNFLGTMGATPTDPVWEITVEAINDHGQMTGYAYGVAEIGNFGAFFWDPETGFQAVPLPEDVDNGFTISQSLNNNGQVVGYYQDYDYNPRFYNAFVWDAAGGTVDLGHLLENDEDHTFFYAVSWPWDINDEGTVVGTSKNQFGIRQAVVWEAGTGGPSNTAPTADAGADQTLEATGMTTPASLSGTGADEDGDSLTYSWMLNGTEVSTLESFSTDLALGSYTFSLTVSDGEASATDEVLVIVNDTVAPEITYTSYTPELSTPNHKMNLVIEGLTASDATLSNFEVTVSSNEDLKGRGDGNTGADWEIADKGNGSYDVYTRAERSGKGQGRVYTITATASDAAGNNIVRVFEVKVPKSKGNANGKAKN